MVDSRGNQCAAITIAYAPCQMDPEGVRTDWEKCPLRQQWLSEHIVGGLRMKVVVAPLEQTPLTVSFREWEEMVMADDYPRPARS